MSGLTRLTRNTLVMLVLLVSLICHKSFASLKKRRPLQEEANFLLLGVSGGLQEGFPDHDKIHYHLGHEDESKAIFLGRALVRGYKAYLDVMQEGWRQYTPEPDQPLINSVVMASGCHEHANEYWVYIVDARQVLSVLNNEPRFLSVTPDTGLVDLTATETNDAVRDFCREQIMLQGKSDMDRVALPIVTAVWYNSESFVPSPPIHIKEDGTEVTNFPESLALWAGVNDEDRIVDMMCVGVDEQQQCPVQEDARQEAKARYWDGIRHAIRTAETINRIERNDDNGPPFECKQQTRFGVGPETARINSPFVASDLAEHLGKVGYHIDFERGTLISLQELSTSEQ